MRIASMISVLTLSLLAGCGEKPAATPVQTGNAHNAFTDHVDRGIDTMNRAQSVAQRVNEQTQAQQAPLQDADAP